MPVTLRLYDTATRGVHDFVPLIPGQVGIYHCGLTVQGPPHIGHIRKELTFDVARRWLEHLGYEVTLIANITDIDDKVLAKETEEHRPWWSVAYANERALQRPTRTPGLPASDVRAAGDRTHPGDAGDDRAADHQGPRLRRRRRLG